MPPGMMPAPMIFATQSPAASDVGKADHQRARRLGLLQDAHGDSVTTPSSPSEPVITPIRS
jgi:hypothetical protein